jgi:large subunit ribosomal protein L31
MKANLHPKLNKIKIELLNGKMIDVLSTYGKDGSILRCEIDFAKHPAWTLSKTNMVNATGASIVKYNKKGGMNLFAAMGISQEAVKPEEDKKSEEGDKNAK